MAADTQPLTPLPPDVIKYEERVKCFLASLIIVGFFGVIGLWTFWPPHMPGSTDGMIIGGLLTAVTAIVTSYWKEAKK